jgi:hypothetical protein
MCIVEVSIWEKSVYFLQITVNMNLWAFWKTYESNTCLKYMYIFYLFYADIIGTPANAYLYTLCIFMNYVSNL